MEKMTLREAAITALAVQNAVNLSGIVHSFSGIMEALWEDAREHGKGTEYVNTHPVVTVFLEKLMDLNRYRVGDSVARDEDFATVELLAKGE